MRHYNVGTEAGDPWHAFSQHPRVEVVLGYRACAVTSGGILEDASLQWIASEFLEASFTGSSKGLRCC